MRSPIVPVVLLGVSVGLAVGVGGYTFVYARGASYLTDDAAACANCHVMREYYDGWLKSSHRAVAVCNDCHTPAAWLAKYSTKASNGFWHSLAFTTGRFPDVLRIKPHNRQITQQACEKCHASVVEAMNGPHAVQGSLLCVACHASVGHPR